MRPLGHLLTSVPLAAGIYAATRSAPLALGAFAGGFLIDLDHYFDYFVFNGQRDPSPRRFHDYYIHNRFRLVVLALHSYELFLAQALLAYLWACPWIAGYLFGAALHMSLDLVFNGAVIRDVIPFYSFLYRARHGFLKAKLLKDDAELAPAPQEA